MRSIGANTGDVAGQWYGSTTVHPLGLLMLVMSSLALLVLHRSYAILPLLIMTIFVSPAQRIVVGGIDFTFLRILIIVGWIRIILTNEIGWIRLRALDFVIVVWALVGTTLYFLREQTISALVYQLGNSFDALGLYILLRVLIRERADLHLAIRLFMSFAIPVLAFFMIETLTGRNVFSVFGGVPPFTAVREGRLRVQGAFAHPIVAGVFWATVLPLIAYKFWEEPRERVKTGLFVLAVLSIVLLTASSTPLMTIAAVAAAAVTFRIRHRMVLVRLALVAALIALQIVMDAPVWHLISRIDLAGGSTGWHRYNVINQAVVNFHEWAVIGTSNIDHWNIWYNDVTNEYVRQGLRGGLVTATLFGASIVVAFQYLGKLRRQTSCWTKDEFLIWGLGCAVFGHTVSFLVLSYFGQVVFVWYFTLAAIGSLYQRSFPSTQSRTRPGREYLQFRPVSSAADTNAQWKT